MTLIVFLLIAVAPGTVEVRAQEVLTERDCRAAAASAVSGQVMLDGSGVLVGAACEGRA